MFSIAYFTNRTDPKIEWFFYSLNRELKENWNGIEIIIIDYHLQFNSARKKELEAKYLPYTSNVIHASPKPCVWQGIYKKTSRNYFAASNARNTAFALCNSDYIVCVDDLSVLKEGWLDVVKWGIENDYVILGAYAKAKELVCNSDGVYSFNSNEISLDSRYDHFKNDVSEVNGDLLYGCSFGLPLKYVLAVDGFDESCDGQGAEDYDFGIRLNKITRNIFYCKKMFTYENEELHHSEGNQRFESCIKEIKETGTLKIYNGHLSDFAKLWQVKNAVSPLPYIPSKLTELRKNIESFPIPEIETDWRDGQPLTEM